MQWDLTLYLYKIQVIQMLTTACKQQRCKFCQDFLQFAQQYPAILDCLWFNTEAHFHLDRFVNKQDTRSWVSEHPHSHGDITASCKMHCVVCSQNPGAYWTNLCGRHCNKPVVCALTVKWGHSGHLGSRAWGHVFPADGECPHTVNVVLIIPRGVFGSHVTSISRAAWVWVTLDAIFIGHDSQQLFPLGTTWKILCTAPTHTLFRSFMWKLKLLLKRSQVTQLTTLWFAYGEFTRLEDLILNIISH
jgi:hypothetical protein